MGAGGGTAIIVFGEHTGGFWGADTLAPLDPGGGYATFTILH